MNLVEALGLDPANIEWHQLALCQGTEISWFYDLYESDPEVASQVDQMCLACPVIKECGLQGGGGEFGVWGAIYWAGNGKPDKAKNSAKTPEIWKMIAEKYK